MSDRVLEMAHQERVWPPLIPHGWRAVRLKRFADLITQKLIEKPEGVPYIALENIESESGRLIQGEATEEVDSSVSTFRRGDILFGKLRPYLAKAIEAPFDGVCSSELVVLRPNAEANGRFIRYELLSEPMIQRITAETYGVRMPRASPEQVANLILVAPRAAEQRAIADFLDRETAKIDALIAKKKRLIELLEEKRATLITQAVTRGLDPSVPMKDSGVEWLGKVPAHWNVGKLKRVSELQTGVTLGKRYESGSLESRLYLRVANVQDGYLDLEEMAEIVLPSAEIPRYELRAGDVVVTEGGDFDKLGRGYLWEGQIPGCLHQNHIFAIRPCLQVLNPKFLAHATASGYGRAYFTATSVQSTNLACTNGTKVREFPLPLPDSREQDAIVEAIEKETAKLDALSSKVRDAIDKLHEYRVSLISAAVTGKIDVRESADSEPEDNAPKVDESVISKPIALR